ncbi:CHAT domain-containing protein [Nocardioides iriomotensis]|uniref:CHAT domain-containing protein n=1 Tax=Nocardioides iriomotensis TaxID=715784 RepID=A0A4Q5J9Y7_9ACTN|nr:CHAT domain-containing protein [Nocardioides iriomotensis]RYU14828.1 CHAT domain-containing protein [Nocardioides iriomotensis]
MGDNGGIVAAVVFNADLSVDVVGAAINALDPAAHVVFVDHDHRPPRFLKFQAGIVRRALERDENLSDVRHALNLGSVRAAPTLDVLTTPNGWASAEPGTVVLEGRQVLGVAIAAGGTRGVPVTPPPPEPPAPVGSPLDATAGGLGADGGADDLEYDEGQPWDGLDGVDVDGDAGWGGSGPGGGGSGRRAEGGGADRGGGSRGRPGGYGYTPGAGLPRPAPPAPPMPAPMSPPPTGGPDPHPMPAPVGDGNTGTDREPEDRARFRAFPSATGPAEVQAGELFTVSVGFTTQATSAGAKPVVRANAAPELTFEVQADGFGFHFPDGIRLSLTVERDNPTTAKVAINVVADDVPVPVDRSVEVMFSIGGGVVGFAWCDLTVHPAQHPTAPGPSLEPPADAAPSKPVATGSGGGTAIGTAGEPADLTVTILTSQGSPEIHWQFHTPYSVDRPDGQVTNALPAANAQAFADQLMGQLPALKGSGMLDNAVRGLGLDVSGVFPLEFWHVLADVWVRVRQESPGRVPTLMFITSEPFVPWELAWVVGDQHVPSSLLPDVGSEEHRQLGVLWSIGRWITPAPQPMGPARPVTPPEPTIDATTMAVVIGDYQGPGVEKLVHAVDEGNALTLIYDAVSVGIDEGEVLTLMDDQLTRDEVPYRPAVVHMAAHGKVGLTAQQYTGIVLGNKRVLDPWVIKGSKLGRESRPFVFLNACQVGTASTVLNTYGGLAAAFLVSGCRGFLAPLWNVDDDVARDLSLRFYEQVLDDGVSVGEAVRQMRASFLTDPDATASATPLAYTFYGHPNLVLRRPRKRARPQETTEPKQDPEAPELTDPKE